MTKQNYDGVYPNNPPEQKPMTSEELKKLIVPIIDSECEDCKYMSLECDPKTYKCKADNIKAASILSLMREVVNGIGNPFHKTGDYGHGKESWNEQPEFQAFEDFRKSVLKLMGKE
jgi:hypothetical protein